MPLAKKCSTKKWKPYVDETSRITWCLISTMKTNRLEANSKFYLLDLQRLPSYNFVSHLCIMRIGPWLLRWKWYRILRYPTLLKKNKAPHIVRRSDSQSGCHLWPLNFSTNCLPRRNLPFLCISDSGCYCWPIAKHDFNTAGSALTGSVSEHRSWSQKYGFSQHNRQEVSSCGGWSRARWSCCCWEFAGAEQGTHNVDWWLFSWWTTGQALSRGPKVWILWVGLHTWSNCLQ